VLESAKLG